MNYRRSETQYAIAVREGAELLQTHTIRRSKTGIYLIFLRDNPEHDPHTSYHTDGKYHDKSFGHTEERSNDAQREGQARITPRRNSHKRYGLVVHGQQRLGPANLQGAHP
jgi:hypothetical protein